jgi:hypothetical protein
MHEPGSRETASSSGPGPVRLRRRGHDLEDGDA